ncbi:MAG: hypothetical protein Q8Q08_06855 [Candidatus Omnitrophota bacterium]|nr:hypothetical protein [Candidatus Omnitrophota bacterium]MDZ4242850.1 hypothetical protein [Candidatus Omnitrophota bacterium]
MTRFEKEYFQPLDFTGEQIQRYWDSASRDFEIAEKDAFREVKFSYAYQALIKTGIALLAKAGKVKVRSVPGHHIKILEKVSALLKDPDVLTIGNVMRMKRNQDLYSGGEFISDKEAEDYLKFVARVMVKARRRILS